MPKKAILSALIVTAGVVLLTMLIVQQAAGMAGGFALVAFRQN